MTTLDVFGSYLLDNGRSPRTARIYVQDLALFGRWFEQTRGEPLAPEGLTPTDVRQYRQHMAVVRRLSPATVNRRLASLRAYARFARQSCGLDLDPTAGVKGVSEQPAAPRWLDRREQAALVREAERDLAAARTAPARQMAVRDLAIVVLLLHAGLRVAELCDLRLSDLEISERKGALHVRMGKGGKARIVPLNRTARVVLGSWLELRPAADTDHVFIGRRGEGLRPRAVQDRLARLARRAGVKATPHMLRHSFAKNLVDAGVSLEKIAALLGHASLDTTRVYILPSLADLDLAVRALEE